MRERARERKTERDREKRERWETLPQGPERKQRLDRLAQNYLCMCDTINKSCNSKASPAAAGRARVSLASPAAAGRACSLERREAALCSIPCGPAGRLRTEADADRNTQQDTQSQSKARLYKICWKVGGYARSVILIFEAFCPPP